MEYSDPSLSIHTLLPLKRLVITLEAVGTSHPGFFHQAALTAFLRHLADSPEDYDLYIRIDAPETGRVVYAKGDFYRFSIIGLNGSELILSEILNRLAKLPESAPKKSAKLPFRNNWRLVGVQDELTSEPVDKLAAASCYDEDQLNQEVELWIHQHQIHWRWITPARLLRDKDKREQYKKDDRYCRDASDFTEDLLLNRVHDTIADLLRRRGEKTAHRGAPATSSIDGAHLFWMDTVYLDSKGIAQDMGGVTGHLNICFPNLLTPAWWRLLILGQYTGAGQMTAFGWGRYQLQTPNGELSCRRIYPALSMLTFASREDNLVSAWKHVMSGITQPSEQEAIDDDGSEYLPYDQKIDRWDELEQLDTLPEAPIERLQKDLHLLQSNQYHFPLLRGYLLRKASGGFRALAVPPIYDRVLQRSLAQVLSVALEKLMHRHSHGYRPGRSRITASYDIQAAWRAGYRWVYESDIEDFFDSVNLARLGDRLSAIYGDDPMISAIIGWMSAAVQYNDQTIERVNGLPQGGI